MAFTDLGQLANGGSSGNNQVSLAVNTAASAAAGELVVVCVTVDNQATGGGDDASTSGVTIALSGGLNPLSLTKGRQNATNLAAQAGASVSLWYGILPIAYPSGSPITASFTTNSTSDASALSARHFSFVGLINSVAVEATNATTATTTNPGSLTATTANIACLRIRATGCEYDSTQTITTTSTWTTWTEAAAAATGTITEQVIEVEHLISTTTSAASAPTLGSACDSASVYVAFKELANPKRLPILDVPKGPLQGAISRRTHLYSTSPENLAGSVVYAPVRSDWFNPWGFKPLVQDFRFHNILLTPPPSGDSITVDAASLTLSGSAITLLEGDIANFPAGMVGGYAPWAAPRGRQDFTYRPLTLYQTILETITVDSTGLTLSGSSISEVNTIGITSGSLTLSGSEIGAVDGITVTSASLSLVGGSIGILEAGGETVDAAALVLTGPTYVGVIDLEAVGSASLALSGSDIEISSVENAPSTIEWFNPWGPNRGRQQWIRGSNPQLFPIGNVEVESASLALVGRDIGLIDSADVFMPSSWNGGFNPWGRPYPRSLLTWTHIALPPVKYVFRQPLITRLWRRDSRAAITSQQAVWFSRFIPTTEAIPIVSANLVPIASTIGVLDTEAITSGALALAASSVGESDSVGITASTLTLTVQDITLTDLSQDLIPILSVALSLAPQSIVVVDREVIGSESLALLGQDIVSADAGTVAITSTSLTLSPQDIFETETIQVVAASLVFTASEISVADRLSIVSVSLALVGSDISLIEGVIDVVTVDSGAIALSGGTFIEAETTILVAGTLALTSGIILVGESDQSVTSASLVLTPQSIVVTEVAGSQDPGPGRWYSQIGSWRSKDRVGPPYKIYPR